VGGPITQASIGQRVITTIEVTIPDFSFNIVIVDPFPAALEPLDDSIYNVPSSGLFAVWDYWNFYLHSAFAQKEFLPDKVIFYGQNLFAGTHTVTYYSIVNTEGLFVLPPTLVYDAFQPEVMGLAAGGIFTTTNYTAPTSSGTYSTANCIPWTRGLPDIDWTYSPSSNQTVTENQQNSISHTLAIGLGVGLGVGLTVVMVIVATLVWFVWNKQVRQV